MPAWSLLGHVVRMLEPGSRMRLGGPALADEATRSDDHDSLARQGPALGPGLKQTQNRKTAKFPIAWVAQPTNLPVCLLPEASFIAHWHRLHNA